MYRIGRHLAMTAVLVASACSGSDSEPSPSDQSPATTADSSVAPTAAATTEPSATEPPATITSPAPVASSTVVESAPTTESSPNSTDQAAGDTEPDRPLVINGPATVDPDDEADDVPTSDPVVATDDD